MHPRICTALTLAVFMILCCCCSPQLDVGVTLPVASSLRKVMAEIDADIAKLEKERDQKVEAANKDYGPDRAYFALKDKCIERKIEVRSHLIRTVSTWPSSNGCRAVCAGAEVQLQVLRVQ
jgi:hypothetical protein